jgi:UDP-N-acetylglucosamine 2-epimerase (non-hydrolysing)
MSNIGSPFGSGDACATDVLWFALDPDGRPAEQNLKDAMNIAIVAGARPNFMKIAPLLRAIRQRENLQETLIHTGQHYDKNLSDIFFEQLGIKQPDVTLGVGGGTHGQQTARIIERIEPVLDRGTADGKRYDRLVVVGDVNSTMAAAIAAAKLHIPISHVEAGLRSFDRRMPEEINRLITDAISDQLFVSEPAGVENLLREGHPADHIHLVGNLMIDTLRWLLPQARATGVVAENGLCEQQYGVVTLHRPSNVDERDALAAILEVLIDVSQQLPLVFPIHPRTLSRLEEFGLRAAIDSAAGILKLPPIGYLEFLAWTSSAKFIVTDSGGLQEEATALGVPCLTMRSNTERPITVSEGSSTLVGNDASELRRQLQAVMDRTYKIGHCPKLWDGHAAERIVELLVN